MFTGRVVYVIIFSEYISDEWSGRGEKGPGRGGAMDVERASRIAHTATS